jgi:hypothetical protein
MITRIFNINVNVVLFMDVNDLLDSLGFFDFHVTLMTDDYPLGLAVPHIILLDCLQP